MKRIAVVIGFVGLLTVQALAQQLSDENVQAMIQAGHVR